MISLFRTINSVMAAQHRRLRLRDDPNITQYVVDGRATGNKLGIGSYGSVEEVIVNGQVCAGKRIHEVLLDAGNVGVGDITQNYLRECQLMSSLHHPNITQFIGLCFFPDSHLPILLMEKLDRNLDDLLESVPNIPLALKRSVLENVAKGLHFLHTYEPQIIHRDLTAKNVLLTSSLVAKITDLGNSRMVDLQPGRLAQTLSRLPGTMVYMPPEALSSTSRYGPSLDVFSFGHLALFTLTQMFPGDLLESTYPDPDDPEIILGRSEVERRLDYIKLLERELRDGERHPLTQMVRHCLQNSASRRPTTEQLVTQLQRMSADIEGVYGELARLDAIRQVVTVIKISQKETEVREKTMELATKNEEIVQLRHQLELSQTENVRLEDSHREKDGTLQQKDIELQNLQEQLQLLQDQKEDEAGVAGASGNVYNYYSQDLKLPLSLKWSQGSDIPFEMTDYPQAVLVNSKLYVGGRLAWTSLWGRTVMVYDAQPETWNTLPLYNACYFAMVAVNNQLVCAGGSGCEFTNSGRTAALGVWNERSQTWTSPYPPMPTARISPTAVSHTKWLVVIGGRLTDVDTKLCNVEILDTSSGQWYIAAPLPQPHSSLSAVVMGYTCYAIGGFTSDHAPSRNVYRVNLDDLVSQAVSRKNSSTPPPQDMIIWHTLPDTPLEFSTALALNGSLLALGGEERNRIKTAIYLYELGDMKWIRIGEMCTGRSRFACKVLPDGRILVAGGTTSSPKAVDIAVVQ